MSANEFEAWFDNEWHERFRGNGSTSIRAIAEAAWNAAQRSSDKDWWQTAVHTLIGHAIIISGAGENDMPRWFFELAEKIARDHLDEGHAARVRDIAARQFPPEPPQ